MGMGYALAIFLWFLAALPLLWFGGWILGDFLERFSGRVPQGPGPRVA